MRYAQRCFSNNRKIEESRRKKRKRARLVTFGRVRATLKRSYPFVNSDDQNVASQNVGVWRPLLTAVSVTTPCGSVLIAATDAGYCSSGLILSGVRTRNGDVEATRKRLLFHDRYAFAVKELR